ncbi:LGFP repeat-containing protein [Tsukamurella soli]|uniref:LGFP repeat-containing protein n=1 Tax=Tsukamurella soli TaxID=644556 RepID=A0ABP8JZW2_9ACTN
MASSSIRRIMQLGVAAAAIVIGLSGGVVAVAHADQTVGKYVVEGRIEAAYFASGGRRVWGGPTGPEKAAANGGRYQDFAKDVAFYWSPNADGGTAHEVGGAIRSTWKRHGGAKGVLGYPTSNEVQAKNSTGAVTAAYSTFQGGVVYWSPLTGAYPVWGQILVKWSEAKREAGTYGYPVADEQKTATGFSQRFQNGTITWP